MRIFGYRLIDLINPIRWFKFLTFKEQERTNITEVPTDEIQTRAELLVFRGIKCPECRDSGKKKCCNCDWTASAYDPEEACKYGKWDATTVEDFEALVEGAGIRFKIGR